MSTVVIASPSCSPSTITAPGQSATSRCSAADQERYEDALARVERYEREVMDLRRQLRVQGIEENRALDFKKRAEEAEEANVEMKQALTRAQDNNRHLFDAVQDLKGNLRVMCRIRPQIAAEDGELQKLQVSQGKNSDHLQVVSLIKRTARSDSEIDHFTMERVFEMAETNKQIFTEVGQLVGSAMNGRNVCVFAYGQTGSGKTHTMTYPWNKKIAPGGDVDSGIIPSSVELISNQMSKRADSWKYSVTGKYVEIYAEKVYDLLRDNFKENVAVALKFNVQKSVTVFWAESTTVDLTKDGNFVEKVKLMLTKASKNRRTRATEKNLESSRSHSVLSLRIVGERIDGKRGFTDGTLNLIDLAGSERPSTTDSASQKEGIAINLSLSTLRKILKEMADPTVSRFSFRESTLTKLLSSSLGEGCRIMMFVMISPSAKDRDETRNTLQFAIEAQRPS
ncbi:P-loop containing nucleoside triphosphate hydrolase protein [Calycina marina]|uniref:Kinesin-like protein n=1 Tax=Calycina marina TaxID=1763456 RepID=A0A9P8CCK8_9HELO|nr:P-loop containing nucleoside triphosphate hydrolase protein [Calycina marina]